LRIKKKITIIGPKAYGYTSYIHSVLLRFSDVDSHLIFIDQTAFKYKNFFQRIEFFFLKILFKKKIKRVYLNNSIMGQVEKFGKQDYIFIIRPDELYDETLKFLSKKAENFVGFYYDSTRRLPRKVEIISFFDTLYSYDKEDVEKYDLKFLTNYIFEESKADTYEYLFFNISSMDFRFPSLEAIAKYIDEKKWSKQLLVYTQGNDVSDCLTILKEKKEVSEVSELIKKCKIIVEIQRNDQTGLSFRAFEALGHRKKLITTNDDIVNYDFYNPQNILVIDENNIEIPDSFVNLPYVEVAPEILNKYKIENWVKPIFQLK